MRLMDGITNDAKQQFNFLGEAGQNISFYLYFMPTQAAWACNIKWDTFELNGLQLTVGVNILRNWRNIINFGMMMTSIDGFEAQFIDDFLTGRIKLFLLNQAEVNQIEAGIF